MTKRLALRVHRQLTPSWEHKLLSNAPGAPCVRVLFALVSGHMLLLAAFLVHLQLRVRCSKQSSGNNTTELGAGDAVLSLWILGLLYGGGCGVYAAATRSLTGAVQTLGCWGFATVAHTWYLLFGVQIAWCQLDPPESALASANWSLWAIVFHVLIDVLGAALLVCLVVLLRGRERAGGDQAELQSLTGTKSKASDLAQYV